MQRRVRVAGRHRRGHGARQCGGDGAAGVLCTRNWAQTFIYLSSLSIYGTISDAVVGESTPLVNPDAYGLTKYLGELLLRELPVPLRSLFDPAARVLGRPRAQLAHRHRGCGPQRTPYTYLQRGKPFNNAAHIDDLCRLIADLLERATGGHDAVTSAPQA